MKYLKTLLFIFIAQLGFSQSFDISGHLLNTQQEEVSFANVVLYQSADNSMVKVEASDIDGNFTFKNTTQGDYYIQITYIGLEDKRVDVQVQDQNINLGTIEMINSGIELETATVTARRALVEVKADKTVFNVEGTVNSAGNNIIELLRKAPGVMLDNNKNITVLGRTGVLVYINGKKLPMAGDDLTNYLESIPSEQVDRIDIITSPGAKYEAEGNAGIIDIRLKKNENHGSNGTLSSAFSHGRHPRFNINGSANNRSEKLNVYTTLGYNNFKSYNDMFFENEQNGLFLVESNGIVNRNEGYSGKLGMDYFLTDNHTIGFLYSGGNWDRMGDVNNRIELATLSTRDQIDSVLVANNETRRDYNENTFNVNYAFSKGSKSLNIDADYGRYRKEGFTIQPNTYYAPNETDILSTFNTEYNTPVDIDIYTLKADFEQEALGGKLGLGTKFSRVNTENTFLFYETNSGSREFVPSRSNKFDYDEMVYAGYVSYVRQLNDKMSLSAGLRVETTDAMGDLQAFDPELQEDPVDLNYTDIFPSLGLSYAAKPNHSFNLNYGRRINRPDYNVLNPFREQLSELSFAKGNPFLNPEIVNNYEIGYTYAYRYNFKLSYSRTSNQITRLIGPDDSDPRASFISWDNLATQDVFGLNIALPFQLKEWWSAFFNLSGSYLDNQADYGGDATVDLQAWTYNIYSQHTFNLPKKFIGEISGWFSGPGIWGGVFEYETSWSLNIGLQKKFLNNNLNVKLSGQDLFYQTGWSGVSSFNGLTGRGKGNWDSRRVSLSMSYKFGNNKVKNRNRKTGIEAESKRVSNE